MSEYENMEIMEIFLIVLGLGLILATYVLSEKFDKHAKDFDVKLGEDTKHAIKNIAKETAEYELNEIIDEKVETVEVRLDKITTEKIMAVGNYAEDTLSTIKKNHDEVMFLYNMLNEKEETLKNLVRDIEAEKQSIKIMKKESKEAKNEITKEELSYVEQKMLTTGADDEDEIIWESGNKNEKILGLYTKGLNDVEIAKKLGIGIGEVRLVIDLFKK